MNPRVIGVETEYACSLLGPSGHRITEDGALEAVMSAIRKLVPHLPALHCGGLFLASGGRCYLDCNKVEMTTPETLSPEEATRYVLACDRLLARCVRDIEGRGADTGRVLITKCNVDYSGARSTWGAHESYGHSSAVGVQEPVTFAAELVPHFVSRVIYAGAGGFDPLNPGLEFSVSPRSVHIRERIGESSTGSRPLFHTKNETLCGDGAKFMNRLHVLCGESLCSALATYLKLGTTALIVAAFEAGIRIGESIPLRNPVMAMRRFSRDPGCKAIVSDTRGRPWTAIGIQRHYVARLRDLPAGVPMPSWSGALLDVWERTLDRLEEGPDGVSTALDWAIKWRLYSGIVERAGFTWDRISHLNSVGRGFTKELAGTEHDDHRVPVEWLLGPTSPIPEQASRFRGMLRRMNEDPSSFAAYRALRMSLFETDVLFSEPGRGLFASMDAQGVLDHGVAGVDRIDEAIRTPPEGGRASLRGRHILRLARSRHIRSSACNWTRLLDGDRGMSLDLGNPLESEERWTKVRHGEAKKEQARQTELRDLLARIEERRGA